MENFRNNWLPTVSDWETYDNWKEKGSLDVVKQAQAIYREILAQSPKMLIPLELDSALKKYMERASSAN
ncbi:MAG: trimethylamine methyltransferase family protein [Desulfitobacteriaceae bacterium]|nr:trimethylamine methyltransferase family protein [Desulfitobacteriaceae bacterium]MDD4752741.1 trimethylamine methyltransferase family protein [Desulfitobacteriaceae bacterium]